MNLRVLDLNKANLSKADLSKADLRGVILSEVNCSEANLSKANLSGASLSGVDLVFANLSETKLMSANLSRADLSRADLNRANLSEANLSGTILSEANLISANLSKANLSEANLISANLISANLISANLSRADLVFANFEKADLSGASLRITRSIGADFTGAKLTGACIQNWNIDSSTNLESIVCEFIYLKFDEEKYKFAERRPHNGFFAPEEFVELYKVSLETIDVFFQNGIDWKSFLIAFQQVKEEVASDDFAVQAIEKKSNSFIVRLETSAKINKAEIEQAIKEKYEIQLRLNEMKYRAQLQAKDREIEIYKQRNADMMEITKLLASRPITVEAETISSGDTYQSCNFGIGHISGGQVEQKDFTFNAAEQQSLAETAVEIRVLLNKLSEIYPTETFVQQATVAEEAMQEIEGNPTLKERVMGALRSAGSEAFKEAIDHPVVNVLMAAIEGWQG